MEKARINIKLSYEIYIKIKSGQRKKVKENVAVQQFLQKGFYKKVLHGFSNYWNHLNSEIIKKYIL